MEPKIIAMYLPQFHEIPENNEFWGKGFSDWVTVKKAKPLFKGHDQPKVPLNGNYYDLSQKESIKWQAELAKKYGVYGFGIYHYWFNNDKNLLTKPAEIILENKDIDINYFYCWDNASWARSWSNVAGNDWAPLQEKKVDPEHKGKKILIPYILGKEPDWKNHFDYLLPFFKDDRYIKVEGKPIFALYNYSPSIEPMCKYWDQLAKENGFKGIYFIFNHVFDFHIPENYNQYIYQPLNASWRNRLSIRKIIYKGLEILGYKGLETYPYDGVWRNILRDARKNKHPNWYLGAFVRYDDTPRRGKKGKIITGATPDKFKKYISNLLKISKQQKKKFIFLTAWNEWGEGAYMEPDTESGYAYLEALKSALDENK